MFEARNLGSVWLPSRFAGCGKLDGHEGEFNTNLKEEDAAC